MNLKIILIQIAVLAIIVFSNCNQNSSRPVLRGPYFGQKPPGITPEVFEPNIVSTGLDELNSVFSPDGNEFYFCIRNFSGAVSIFQMKMKGGRWALPLLLPFASRYGDIDVTLSPDGQKMFFCSRRPIPGTDKPKDDYDFWSAQRKGGSWDAPVHLGSDINSDSHDFYPMAANGGTLYFSSQREGSGTNNIYKSYSANGKYSKAVKLSNAVNTEHREFDPYISPDEQILIFTSNRPDGFGSGDLYISFKDQEQNWTPAENMGSRINTAGAEYCPMISPDGNYLFFTGARRDPKKLPDKPLTYQDFKTVHIKSKNRNSDIYWVDAKIIDKLKPKNLK